MKLTGIVENGVIKLPAGESLPEGQQVQITVRKNEKERQKDLREQHRKASLTSKHLVPGLPAGLC